MINKYQNIEEDLLININIYISLLTIAGDESSDRLKVHENGTPPPNLNLS